MNSVISSPSLSTVEKMQPLSSFEDMKTLKKIAQLMPQFISTDPQIIHIANFAEFLLLFYFVFTKN